ncbi:nucleoside triphosphate pyrophosphohydrolase [bacterium]|nr:MAG: nucleoside triphosphate pyrophosphohydrolase [bacterium]
MSSNNEFTETEKIQIGDDSKTSLVREQFGRLYNIMRELRTKCPWDREQTHDSLRQYLLEEVYEVLETLDEKHYEELCKEMGDLMLQILFHSRITSENNIFDITDVIRSLNDKLIRRHPHVFGEVIANDAEQVLKNWEQIKLTETDRQSVLDGVPKTMPALARAYRVQEKASRVGFDWGDIKDVWPKVYEELKELEEALEKKDLEKTEDELGDVLFSIVNISRFLEVNPEDALRGTIEKFMRRFMYVEQKFTELKRPMKGASLEEMDVFWNEAKKMELK